jgi:hypothetical protein
MLSIICNEFEVFVLSRHKQLLSFVFLGVLGTPQHWIRFADGRSRIESWCRLLSLLPFFSLPVFPFASFIAYFFYFYNNYTSLTPFHLLYMHNCNNNPIGSKGCEAWTTGIHSFLYFFFLLPSPCSSVFLSLFFFRCYELGSLACS